MTKAEILKYLEKYRDDADFPDVKFPDVPENKLEELLYKLSSSDGSPEIFDLRDEFAPYIDYNKLGDKIVEEYNNSKWLPNEEYYGKMRRILEGFKNNSEAKATNSYEGLSYDALPKEVQDVWFNKALKYKDEWAEDSDPEVRAMAEQDAVDIARKLYADANEEPEAKVEEKVEVEDPSKDLKTVYTTTDGSELYWDDPVAFKKFAIGPLIWGLNKEDRAAALKDYWKMSPEDLINNDKLTGGSFKVATGDEALFNDKDGNLGLNHSLRSLYGSNDATDPFDNDLYDLLDNFNGDIEDVNGDGDPDVMTEDTDGDGEADTATVTADDEAEAAEGVAEAKKSLDDKKVEQDSTGSLNDKPSEDVSDEKLKNKKSSGCVSDEKVKDKKHPEDCSCAECTKKKEQELSDSRFKNIVNTLVDKLW